MIQINKIRARGTIRWGVAQELDSSVASGVAVINIEDCFCCGKIRVSSGSGMRVAVSVMIPVKPRGVSDTASVSRVPS